jgi:glycosyltransferase involved in cell wall biosynthesis
MKSYVEFQNYGFRAPNRTPIISVVICTYNRVEYLLRAIKSVLDQDYPDDQYELVVIDNASTDSTADQVRPFFEAGRLRYIHEPELGISAARNTGWREATGHYVAYLDDDAIASPGWLPAIEKAFELTPNAGVVGGRVDPIWEVERPDWLDEELVLSLGVIDWGEKPKLIPDLRMEWLVTANMAIPRSLIMDIGGFETRLGSVGKMQVRGEDTFFQKQVIRQGYPCYYYPDMVVKHHIPASRLNKQWFRNRYYTQGITNALTKIVEEEPSVAGRLNMALSMFFKLIRFPGNILNILLPSSKLIPFSNKCLSWIYLGYITGMLTAERR